MLFNVKAREALSQANAREGEDTTVDPQSRIRDFLDRGNLTLENLQQFGNSRLSSKYMIEDLSTYIERQVNAIREQLDSTANLDRYPILNEYLTKLPEVREDNLKSLEGGAIGDTDNNNLEEEIICFLEEAIPYKIS